VKSAYIILAHKRPDLLFRLVAALDGAPVAIHIDRKSNIYAEVAARARALPNVSLLPRHVCHWGMFGIVRAGLEGLRWFTSTGGDYVTLLSAQCYPIKPAATIAAELTALQGRSLIEIEAFPKAGWMQWERGGYLRIDRFYVRLPGRVKPRGLKLWRRQLPYGLHPYGGSMYWCLSREAADYVLRYISDHPAVMSFFRTVLISDELFFQTILGNSPLRDRLEHRSMHYTDFTKGGGSPAVLGREQLPTALASDAWYARKFEDHTVLDLVDAARGHPADAAHNRDS
jgi:hypothetical protein